MKLRISPDLSLPLDCHPKVKGSGWLPLARGLDPIEHLDHCRLCSKERLRARLIAQVTESPTGCWLFGGPKKNRYGHRQISVHDRPCWAHRLAYAVFVGPIPEGLNVCHSCDVPECISPDHLFVGTQLDNVRDAVAKGRAPTPPRVTGIRNHNATLTDAQVVEIRQRWAAWPHDQRALAAEYGVTQSTIWRIVNRLGRVDAEAAA